MRHVSHFFCLGISLTLLAGCATSAASTPTARAPLVSPSGWVCPEPQPRLPVTSTQLNLFIWSEYVPQDIMDCFELVYGITLNVVEYSSNEEMYAALSSGDVAYDLAQPSDYIIQTMIRNGFAQRLDKTRLPNLINIDPAFANVFGDDNGDYVVPYQAGTQAIVYDSSQVSTPPASWNDLWRPEFVGRIVSVDEPRTIIALTLASEGLDPNTRNPADLEAIRPKLRQLMAAIAVFDNDSPKDALIAGTASVGYVWSAEAELAIRARPELRYAYPQEGVILFEDGFVLLPNAPNVDAAYAWMNYILQGDVFWLMLREFPYTMPNRAVLEFARDNHPDLYAAYINSPVLNTPTDVWAKGIVLADVGEAQALYESLWAEIRAER